MSEQLGWEQIKAMIDRTDVWDFKERTEVTSYWCDQILVSACRHRDVSMWSVPRTRVSAKAQTSAN